MSVGERLYMKNSLKKLPVAKPKKMIQLPPKPKLKFGDVKPPKSKLAQTYSSLAVKKLPQQPQYVSFGKLSNEVLNSRQSIQKKMNQYLLGKMKAETPKPNN